MAAHLAAIQRLEARETALRLHTLRVVFGGEADDVQRFLDGLEPDRRARAADGDDEELRKAMAAFGIEAR